MIISISGKKGHGKDLVGSIIQWLIINKEFPEISWETFNYTFDRIDKDQSNWIVKKWAGAVKHVCSILTGIHVEEFESEEIKNTQLGREWNYFKVRDKIFSDIEEAEQYQLDNPRYRIIACSRTVRQLLQNVGTDAMRDVIHPNVWINALMNQYNPIHEQWGTEGKLFPNWIITDTRFPNELQACIDREGLCIKVVCPDVISNDTHSSETSLDDYENWDCVIIANKRDIESLIDQTRDFLIKYKIIC